MRAAPKLRLRVTRSGNAHPLEVKVALHEPTFGWRFSESGADVVGCTIGPNGSTDLPLSSVRRPGSDSGTRSSATSP
ncbi:hypothetical protein ACFQX7_33755 [Luedemannella flava]